MEKLVNDCIDHISSFEESQRIADLQKALIALRDLVDQQINDQQIGNAALAQTIMSVLV